MSIKLELADLAGSDATLVTEADVDEEGNETGLIVVYVQSTSGEPQVTLDPQRLSRALTAY